MSIGFSGASARPSRRFPSLATGDGVAAQVAGRTPAQPGGWGWADLKLLWVIDDVRARSWWAE